MMKMTRAFLLLILTAMIVACGGPSETPETDPAATETAAPAEVTEVITEEVIVTEDGVEAVIIDETVGNEVEVEEIVIAEAEKPAVPMPASYKEGEHYTKLTAAQGTSSPPDVIEVAEVFWYGCPHCYSFEPIVSEWSDNLPDNTRFIQLPVMWNPTNAIHARLFYTIEALNQPKSVHDAVFKELHVNKNMLTNEDDIKEFLLNQGISEEDFDKTFRSFAVESNLKRAKNLTQRYRIQSVPVMVVNGKYLSSGDGIKSFRDMTNVTDYLITLEEQDR
ncbi:MAG: thiol:disulfide interchange protein DsbA/DsbL [Gammaproteobacteria bacterium]|nr:thiol:disulfide interchange protein DsbA/DsbL [Gammaproteobacteria bacterium]